MNKRFLKAEANDSRRSVYDLTLVVQTNNCFMLGNKIKFSSAFLIFGTRSMAALFILHLLSGHS